MRLFFSIVTLFIAGALAAQPVSFDNPAEYSNYMVEQQIAVANKVLDLTSTSVSTDDAALVNKKRMEVVETLDNAINKISNLSPIGGKSDYRDEVLALMKRYKEVFVVSYVELTSLIERKNASIVDLENYLKAQEKVDKEIGQLEKEVSNAQSKFAKTHNMEMTENPMAAKMERIAAANDYARLIFMEYLKLAKENEKFQTALTAQDAEAMKKARADMIRVAAPVVRRMETFKGHQSYSGFRDAGVKLVQYYERLSQNEYLELVEFIQMSKTEPTTQEEVDKYNAGVERYNAIINKMNVEHTDLINAFNLAHRELLQRNINGE